MNVEPTPLGRRTLFQRAGFGLGGVALTQLLRLADAGSPDAIGKGQPDRSDSVRKSHFPAKVKNVIYLHMVGAPSHLDLFDLKPELQRRTGEDCPAELFEAGKFAFVRDLPTLLGTPDKPQHRFTRSGDSGLPISNLMPHLQGVADELTLIKSMHTNEFNHGPAQMFMMSGFGQFGRPSIGSWVNYGLGSENENLPGFVVLITGNVLGAGSPAWGSGFLPSKFQGVALRSQGDQVLYLSNPDGVDSTVRRRMLDSLARLNQETADQIGDPETQARIAQYEMAFRMQTSIPELSDISDEPQHVLDLYGPQVTTPGTFAHSCLMARRMAERGVRFTQIFHRGWDQHGGIPKDLPNQCLDVDQPSAGLLTDLRQRGMLDDTLVVWGGEFGRTIYCQGPLSKTSYGRDHHPKCFSIWMAGGGVQGGVVHGETDEFSYNITKDAVHVRDLNATILHLMGIDHERFRYPFKGLDQRLTGVEKSRVVKEILS